jgi:cold shock CspA family protein
MAEPAEVVDKTPEPTVPTESADTPGDTGGSVPTADSLEEKAAKAKAILEAKVAASDPYKGIPKEADARVQQAQAILTKAVAKGRNEDFTQAPAQVQGDVDILLAKLPEAHRQMLRNFFWDPYSGENQPYFLGTLKSYSSKAGYGFLECAQTFAYWGCDIFVHKNQVPVPWNLGQPVEFNVILSTKSQPQAADCLWLPKLPQPRVQPKANGFNGYGTTPVGQQLGIFSPNDPSSRIPLGVNSAASAVQSGVSQPPPASASGSAASAASATSAGSADPTTERTAADQNGQRNIFDDGPFFLGSLKSYSSAQGYGFIACDDLFQKYQRDIYFDRSQLPTPNRYTTGQILEFACTLNARGQPQARKISWDPLPLTPVNPAKSQSQPSKAPSASAVDKARKLLKLLNEKDYEPAVITAIDCQGADKTPADSPDQAERNIDFVTFVLDRFGQNKEVVHKIKDFVKMLLLLMIAKMLRHKQEVQRVKQLTHWLQLCAEAIDPNDEKQVKNNFNEVATQIEVNLSSAKSENPNVSEAGVTDSINNVIELLRQKAQA